MTIESPSDGVAVYYNLQPLILASASPRRLELLQTMGLTFQVIPSGIEEAGGAGEAPEVLVKRWAQEKALAVCGTHPNSWVLAADTIVVLGNKIFGKPRDRKEAALMLTQLAGKPHQVISGMCLAHRERGVIQVSSVSTLVRFKRLSSAEIEAYVRTGEPMDKAGGYGIQGVGAFLVRSIDGSYTNVVGLPLCETLECLMAQGVIAPVPAET